MENKTHYLSVDYRIASLDITINKLNEAIEHLKKQLYEIEWYDRVWLIEESEPIYGLVFIAFQNYINGSIKDFSDTTLGKEKFYTIDNTVDNKSKIQLIIGLANYAKHKDDGLPHKGTKEVLDFFNLTYENITDIDKSAIFQGLTILSNEWNLFEIKDSVKEWRDRMWLKSS